LALAFAQALKDIELLFSLQAADSNEGAGAGEGILVFDYNTSYGPSFSQNAIYDIIFSL